MRLIWLIVFIASISYNSVARQNAVDNAKSIDSLNTAAFNVYLFQPAKSIQLAKYALDLAIQSNNIQEQGRSYLALSKAYWTKANFMLSTDYGFRALKVFENNPDSKYLSLTYLALGRTLTELGNYIKAREFIQLAIAHSKNMNDSLGICEGFRELSFLFTEQKKPDSAIYYSDLGIKWFEKNNQPIDLSILYGRKSRIYYELKDYAKSREFAYKGVPLDSLAGNRRALAISKFLAAQSEHKFGNRKVAIDLLKRSIQLSEEIHNPQWLIRAHELLAKLYEETGELKKSNTELKLVHLYQDSLFNIEKSGQAEEMQALYELEGKEKTIKLLENESKLREQEFTNQRLFVAVLVIGIILLAAILFFQLRLRNIQKRANQLLSEQKEEIKKQAENLHQLNDLKTKLFSVISHDLRGPISSLRALLGMLTNKTMTQDEFIMLSDKLKTNIDSTQQTLENLLNWCLTQMEGIKTNPKSVPIGKAIEQTCRLLNDAALSKGISFKRNFEEGATALVDPDQLQLILRNLFHNAIKFSQADTDINLSIMKENDFWKVSITDTGVGMTQDEINTIINTSYHFSKFGTQREKGTGLGLMLCKEFIKLNNGRLEIESETDKGTSVSVLLPRA